MVHNFIHWPVRGLYGPLEAYFRFLHVMWFENELGYGRFQLTMN